MILPSIIRIKVKNEENKGVNLYIPMFLIYLLLLPVLVLLILIWLLFSLFTAGTSRGRLVFNLGPALYTLICSTRGTEVNVKDKNSVVILKIL